MPAAQKGRARLLFVDDEASIRHTMPRILEMHGFDVTVASSVPEALAAMQSGAFDVLLADLNVGQPGDGFTVVSAMRRTQPQAVTLILTGYPAFDTALEAIRKQVDGYVVKPAEIDHLLGTIRNLLNTHQPQHHQAVAAQRVSRLLEQHIAEAAARWVRALRGSAVMRSRTPNDAELQTDAHNFVHWLAERLEHGSAQPSSLELVRAREHGQHRKRQGYTLLVLIEECHLLRQELLRLVEENLLAVEISYVVTDLAALNQLIDAMLANAVTGYLEAEQRA